MMMKKIKGLITHFYERRVAPILAVYAAFFYWPIYKYLKFKKICFVVNIAGGVGHIICELDQFLRKKKTGELDVGKKYFWIRKNDEYSKTCVELYGKHFDYAVCNPWLYFLILPILIRFKDITHDGGLSRLKWQLDPKGKYTIPKDQQTYLYQIDKSECFELWNHYYSLCQKTKGFYPLKVEREGSLKEWIPGEKIVLLQLKDGKKNASACSTDPNSYLPSIQYLKKLGYTLVMAGREKMTPLFEKEGVINYAQSQYASFRNDIELYNLAEFSINSGSGAAFLADSYDRPYLYVNSWQLPMAMFSPKCIMVPTLVQTKDGQFLKFLEQMKLYQNLKDPGKEDFPEHLYTARNANADEILEAVKELLQLIEKPIAKTIEQERWQNLDQNAPSHYTESRVSEYFLNIHRDLF